MHVYEGDVPNTEWARCHLIPLLVLHENPMTLFVVAEEGLEPPTRGL
jgi:hypothetical protein